MTREEILDLVSKMDNLPRLPQVAIKLMEISMDDQTSAKDIADIVMEDPAITAYLLKLINSPFYGLREKVTTVSHGIALLGVDVVKNVVLSLAVLDIMKSRAANNPELRSYWEHSLYTAISARLFAQQVGYAAPEKVFIAGLLADLGSLILWGIDSILYRKVLKKDDNGCGDRSAVEKAFFGLDHAEAGMALAQVWNLPEEYVGVISLHHNLDILDDLDDETIRALGQFVHLGSVVASIFISGEDGFKTVYLKSTATSLFGLQEGAVEQLPGVVVHRLAIEFGRAAVGELHVCAAQAVKLHAGARGGCGLELQLADGLFERGEVGKFTRRRNLDHGPVFQMRAVQHPVAVLFLNPLVRGQRVIGDKGIAAAGENPAAVILFTPAQVLGEQGIHVREAGARLDVVQRDHRILILKHLFEG
jgi:HD-like signal output (HDOD) protein